MTEKKGFIICMLIIIIFMVIAIFVNNKISKNPDRIINKLSEITIDNKKIMLNNNVKDINLDFSIAGSSHPNDEHANMSYVDTIDDIKIKAGDIWYLENFEKNISTSIIGVNNSEDEIFVKDGNISIIVMTIDDASENESNNAKVKIYDDIILGKSPFSKVIKKLETIESKNAIVNVASGGITIEVFNGKTKENSEKHIFAEFKFDDSMILNKITIQDSTEVSTDL